jgi:uncharacterized protein YndB with AHSA1/START domain
MKVEIQGETIVGEVQIDAPPETVFDALTDPAQLESWWGAGEMYRTFDWKMDLRPGGKWSCKARGAKGDVSTLHGQIVEVDRPRTLAYTWNPSWDKIPETEVRYTLERMGAGTSVKLIHSGFAGSEESQKKHTQGWPQVLGWLRGRFQLAAKAAKEEQS